MDIALARPLRNASGKSWGVKRSAVAVLLASVVSILIACERSSPTEPEGRLPLWLSSLIAQIESQPVTNPPSAIYRYRYQGRTVYFRPSYCCDVFSVLYDRNGRVLCAPDGGLIGRGDGRCPDFFSLRSEEVLIWQDSRR
jgi:hypothetical protein